MTKLGLGRLGWVLLGGMVLASVTLPGTAQESSPPILEEDIGESKPIEQSPISEVQDIQNPATTVKEWRAQIEAATVKVTRVKLERTETGLDIVLETAEGRPLQVDASQFRTSGNSLIAEIPNAVLALPEGQEFVAENPTADILTVQVVQQEGDTIGVMVTGKEALPQTEVTLKAGELAYSLNPEGEDEEVEITVTAEREKETGYRVPNASTATRTDTPIRDIPQSIQIVPQQVLEDRQARRITDGLENVSGVNSIETAGGSREYVTIRGFENFANTLIDGVPGDINSDNSFVNVERLEVLKGPASVLYGEGGLGGTINFVTRQPLSDPFYEISATAASFNDYQGVIDLSGPLNDSETALYRLIAGYRSAETFVDFNEFTELSVAPSLGFSLGENTDLVVEGNVNVIERNLQQPDGPPAVGSVLPNPNGEVSRSFSAGGPVEDNITVVGRVGYRFEHRFNENLRLRNAFRYGFYDDDDRGVRFGIGSLEADNRTLNRTGTSGSFFNDTYYLDTNLLGKFSTGPIGHQLLFGFSLSRSTNDLSFEFGIPAAPVDIFDPDYDNTVVPTGIPNFSSFTTRDTLGIYLQDQITIAENLKLLLGGRVDFFSERSTNRLTDEKTSQSDTAFSPRVGIVYQPIQPISLYASYSRSFNPTIGISATGEAFQPDRGTQYEVGVKADINNQLSATLAFYDLTRTNVTTTDPDDSNFSVQTGEQKSQGIELDISGEILPGWNIIAGYAYTDARVTEDNTIPEGNRLYAAPEHAFNLWTTYRIQDGDLRGLGFGLGFYYVGETEGNLANTFEVPSSFRTDAAIFYERDRFRAALNFRNLFDVEIYKAIGSETRVGVGAPFTVQGTISWQF
jgi:iron complex outermembrane recepter protein